MLALPLSPYPTFKWLSGHSSLLREHATARHRAEILLGAKKQDSAIVSYCFSVLQCCSLLGLHSLTSLKVFTVLSKCSLYIAGLYSQSVHCPPVLLSCSLIGLHSLTVLSNCSLYSSASPASGGYQQLHLTTPPAEGERPAGWRVAGGRARQRIQLRRAGRGRGG